MIRKRPRTDLNQPDIVDALRRAGRTVEILAYIGGGCPDLLVGYGGTNYLLEIKRDEKADVTSDEREWIQGWRGQVRVVWTIRQALEATGGNQAIP